MKKPFAAPLPEQRAKTLRGGYASKIPWYQRSGKKYPKQASVKAYYDRIEADLENPALRIVKQERLWWGGRISTVWTGIDVGIGFTPTPLIFETMVFPVYGWHDLDGDRYATEDQARTGHARLKKKWSSPLTLLRVLCRI